MTDEHPQQPSRLDVLRSRASSWTGEWLADSRRLGVVSVLLALDGLFLAAAGLLAISGSPSAVLGEAALLLMGGLGLVLFGAMVFLRWNLRAAKAGLAGLTAGYFATALSEFEVATDPCDVGAALERCAEDVVRGMPYVVYVGPLILGALLFVVILLEPRVESLRDMG